MGNPQWSQIYLERESFEANVWGQSKIHPETFEQFYQEKGKLAQQESFITTVSN